MPTDNSEPEHFHHIACLDRESNLTISGNGEIHSRSPSDIGDILSQGACQSMYMQHMCISTVENMRYQTVITRDSHRMELVGVGLWLERECPGISLEARVCVGWMRTVE